MKLSQLYSNKSFKHIRFNDGVNLVLAQVTKKLDKDKDSHNLGKTTLIFVIDFMLLRKLDKTDIFLKYKDKFSGYNFYLEILLNSGEYLTIRRSVNSPNKVSFKINKKQTNSLNEATWDKTDLSLEKAREALNEYLAFDILPTYGYRKSITYFLRSQKDYNDIFQLSKFSTGKDLYWKPFMFDLLGFDGSLLEKKYKIDTEIEEQKKFIGSLKSKFSVSTEELDKIRGAITLKEQEQKELQSEVDAFNFYQQERMLNRELIEDIEKNISDLNTFEYNLEYDLEKIKQSFSNNISFDIEKLKVIYSETEVLFPDNLVKNYKDLEDFNKKITEERNKYLQERLDDTNEKLKEIRKSLLIYDEKRNQALSILKSKDSFKKFKTYQVNLSKIEGELARLQEQLKNIDKIKVLNEVTDQLNKDLEKLVKEINEQIDSSDNELYPEIRKIFSHIFKYIVNTPAIIFIRQNAKGNIEFEVDVSKENEIDVTAEGKGHTYQKLLCISFDLSLLIAYHKNSFYRFVYHDGAIEGLDNRKKEQFINYIREACTKYNIQYIFTSIQDDIPNEIIKTFKPEEICLTLDDSGDEGKLFGFSF